MVLIAITVGHLLLDVVITNVAQSQWNDLIDVLSSLLMLIIDRGAIEQSV